MHRFLGSQSAKLDRAKDGESVLPRGVCLEDVGAAKDRRQLMHIRGHHIFATAA
jgi:hypothetical protein